MAPKLGLMDRHALVWSLELVGDGLPSFNVAPRVEVMDPAGDHAKSSGHNKLWESITAILGATWKRGSPSP